MDFMNITPPNINLNIKENEELEDIDMNNSFNKDDSSIIKFDQNLFNLI